MFLNFFNELREAKVPVTLKEYLLLMEAMDKQVINMEVEDFYYLSRALNAEENLPAQQGAKQARGGQQEVALPTPPHAVRRSGSLVV